ncbi:HEAT repeat domain-containing protein [Ekhidna sp.]|uniref:HEAT repeat domain-containing protein n=1 Tax=Ekhidna sp. TaxID=2608089 RepID=UPI0035138335
MKEEITDEQIIALLEGEVNPALKSRIDADPELTRRFNNLKEVLEAIEITQEVEVPAHVQAGFQQALLQEKLKGNNQTQWSWMQIAAAIALLVIGFGAGKFSSGNTSEELSSMRAEIQSLKEVTLTNTLQKHSASKRILAVNQIEEKASINRELVSTLITTLNTDESPNVRYAALQALKKFMGEEDVKAELVKSLEAQTDPLIQISLITILVEAEERSAIAPLKDMINDEQTTPEVKQQAQVAIQVLT